MADGMALPQSQHSARYLLNRFFTSRGENRGGREIRVQLEYIFLVGCMQIARYVLYDTQRVTSGISKG